MEPLIHFMIPFVALVLAGFGFRRAFPLALLALTPDLDVLLHVHRSVSHSIFVVAAAFILLTPLFMAFKAGRYAPLAFLAVASHPILDVFTGATPILWPLVKASIYVEAALMFHFGSSPNLTFNIDFGSEPVSFTRFSHLDAPLATGEGLILSLILLAAVFAGQILKHRARSY